MADFKQALEWLNDGKKIRRSCWNNPYAHRDLKIDYWSVKLSELKATDWELYEPEDTWNLNDQIHPAHYYREGTIVVHISEIYTFVNKVKADIKRELFETCYVKKEVSLSDIENILDKRAGFK